MEGFNGGRDGTDRDQVDRERTSNHAVGRLVGVPLPHLDPADREQPPRLRELRGVVAIAQTASRGNVSLTLFSLESYAEGFAIEARRVVEEGHPAPADARRRREEVRRNGEGAARSEPEVTIDPELMVAKLKEHASRFLAMKNPTATDDRGTRYRSWLVGGSGEDEEARLSYVFAPPLDPAARELRIEIPFLRWPVWDSGGRDGGDSGTDVGPWSFAFPLAPGTWVRRSQVTPGDAMSPGRDRRGAPGQGCLDVWPGKDEGPS